MVDKIRPSRREFLATDAAATSALLLDQHQQTDPAIAHVDDVATVARIPTGFQQLDILTGGLHRRELVLLASRPGVGMTSLALNITDYTAVEAYTPTLYVSLGTSRFEITRRLMCARGEVCHTVMRRHTVSPDVGLRMTQAGAELSSAPLYLDDRPLRTVAEISTTVQRLRDRLRPVGGLGLLVVDHLARVEAEYTGQTETEYLTDVAYRLREMAIEMNLAVLGLVQLPFRPFSGRQTEPALAELRGTQYAADLVMLLHRPQLTATPIESHEAALETKAELAVLRRHDCLAETIDLSWTGQCGKFSGRRVRLHQNRT